MASGKSRTTMVKLARERKLRERRIEKQAKKAARKLSSAEQQDPPNGPPADQDQDEAGQGPDSAA